MLRGIFCHGTYRRQHLISDDGGTLGLDWFNQCERASFADPSTPVLLVMHGINGERQLCATHPGTYDLAGEVSQPSSLSMIRQCSQVNLLCGKGGFCVCVAGLTSFHAAQSFWYEAERHQPVCQEEDWLH